MKKASEMKQVAIGVKEAQEAALHERAKDYAENVVMAEIERAAAKGEFKAVVNKSDEVKFEYLRHYLESFGYKITTESYSTKFTIYW